MAGIVRIHRPNLTPEEREYRMEQIKKATIQYWSETNEIDRQDHNRISINDIPIQCIING